MALLDECLKSQTAAGFQEPDRRHVNCPGCSAEGYNSGWGYWRFECGAEFLSDGTSDKPCPKPR